MKEKSAGVLTAYKDKNELLFLLIHQVSGHWAFPKGHVEKGETEIETAKRELFEETGIENVQLIEGFRYLQTYSFEKDGVKSDKEVVFFLGMASNKNVTLEAGKVQMYKWLPLQPALEQLTHESNKTLLLVANEFLNKNGAVPHPKF